MTETEILVEQQPPQGVFVCDHAGLVIDKFSRVRRESVSDFGLRVQGFRCKSLGFGCRLTISCTSTRVCGVGVFTRQQLCTGGVCVQLSTHQPSRPAQIEHFRFQIPGGNGLESGSFSVGI